jgi:predicted peptidase
MKVWKSSVGCVAILLMIVTLTCTTAGAFALSAEDLQARKYVAADGKTMPYRLYIPPNYQPDKHYPLILFLHGIGERGDDNLKQLRVSSPLTLIESSKEPMFFVAPQCPPGKRWVERPRPISSYTAAEVPVSENLQLVLQIIEQVQQEYSIDASRLYATGLSMGGFGTWDIITRRPHMFAAAIPICGGGDKSQVANLKGMGIWAFHAADDSTVSVNGSRDMIRALWAAGQNPSYTEYTSGGHNSWDRAYQTAGLVVWLLSFHRQIKSTPDTPHDATK